MGPVRRSSPQHRREPLSVAADLIREGETVLSIIDPAARGRDPNAFTRWLSARLMIGELSRVMLPACDDRCRGVSHAPERIVVVSDLAVDPTLPRAVTWWSGWNETLEQTVRAGTLWYAGAPALPVTPDDRRLRAGTALRRVATTDPHWVAYDGAAQETLYRISDGPMAGGFLVAVTFGHAPLLPTFAGALLLPDHPPTRDPAVAARLLAAGWAAVERGLPFEET